MSHSIVAHIILTIAIAIMGGALVQSHKLMEILKGSKVESFWRQAQIGLYLLTGFFIMIMISRLSGIGSNENQHSTHDLLMNTAFLLTSILLLRIVNLDIKAFSSLFELLGVENISDEILESPEEIY